MDRTETIKIIAVIRAAFPMHLKNLTNQDLEQMISVWQTTLDDVPYSLMSAGLKTFIRTDKKGFPPTPGQILNIISNLQTEAILTAEEAWTKVYKAICNSLYDSEKEFANLPLDCQRAIGSAENLKELSKLDISSVETAEKSHFIRTYNSVIQNIMEDRLVAEKERNLIKEAGNEFFVKRFIILP